MRNTNLLAILLVSLFVNSCNAAGLKGYAPHFSLSNQVGRLNYITLMRGHDVLLYFYDKNSEKRAVDMAQAVNSNMEKLAAKGIVVAGINAENPHDNIKFHKEQNISHLLLSDEDNKVKKKYKATNFFGKAKPVAYLVDQKGEITKFYSEEENKDPNALVLDVLQTVSNKAANDSVKAVIKVKS